MLWLAAVDADSLRLVDKLIDSTILCFSLSTCELCLDCDSLSDALSMALFVAPSNEGLPLLAYKSMCS